MSQDLAKEVVSRCERLASLRQPWNQLFQDCADYILPRRSHRFVTSESVGQPLTDRIFDGTAPWANEQLAAGLHSFCTSPTQRWFRLKMKDEELNEDDEVRAWLQDCADRMYNLFNNDATQFNPQMHELYLDLGALGTSVLFMEELDDPRKPPIRFQTQHLGECYIAENEHGKVDTLYHDFKMTARNAVRQWPNKLPEKVQKDAEKDPWRDHHFVHAVYPNSDYTPARPKIGSNRPFLSVYVYKEEPTLLTVGGFKRFPFRVPRWSKVSGETYGRSPGMTCLPDIRMVNEMSKTIIIAAQKIVDPALQMPDEGFLLPIKTSPGGINYYDASLNENNRIMPIETKGRVDIGEKLIERRQEHIIRSFYTDYMQLQQGPQMTATEVVQRNEDKMRLMAPMVGRLQSELLNEMIEHTFAVMMEKRLFKAPPRQIEGRELAVDYVSPVARAQKMTQLFGFQRMIEGLTQLAGIRPEVLDRIQMDNVPVVYAEMLDVPAKLIKTDEQMQAEKAQREQQQEMVAQSAIANQASDTLANVAKASPEVAARAVGGPPPLKRVK